MGWLQILLLLIQYGPALVKLVREIWALIKSLQTKDVDAHAKYKEKLRLALDEFKRTRDKGALEKLRDELK